MFRDDEMFRHEQNPIDRHESPICDGPFLGAPQMLLKVFRESAAQDYFGVKVTEFVCKRSYFVSKSKI